MTNTKDENKKQNNTLKEKEGTKEFLDNQTQEIKNTTTTISNTSNRINENINEYQKTSNEIIEKSIDMTNKYQQQAINTIQTIANNYVELQNNILNIYQSSFSRFLDNLSQSYWNNYRIPERYAADAANKTNQNITNNRVNVTRRLDEFISKSTETFNKSIEITQRYYNDSVKNYFNFVNEVQRSYNY